MSPHSAANDDGDVVATRAWGPHARLSKLGFGCGRIGSFNNPMSARDTQRLLEAALDCGVTLFDTADIYGQGDSERAVGHLLRGRREDAVVITKVGRTFSTAMRVLRPLKPLLKPLTARSEAARTRVSGHRASTMATDFSCRYVTEAIDRSLRRLRCDTIDALLLHSPTDRQLAVLGLEDVLDRARGAGKIGSFGVACDDAASVEAALRFSSLSIIEVPPPVLDEAGVIIGDAVRSRALKVLVREVIRYRGKLSPTAAVSAMAARQGVASVVAGTTSIAHLHALARAANGDVAATTSVG